MTPSQLLLTSAATLLAGDTAGLNAALDVEIHLAKNAFTESPSRVLGDFTEADFDGYAALAKDPAAPTVVTDPATGDQIITLPDPAGGWAFATTGVTNLPQTIYGYYLTDSTGAVLYGCKRFADAVVLTGNGQGFSIGTVDFRMLVNGIV